MYNDANNFNTRIIILWFIAICMKIIFIKKLLYFRLCNKALEELDPYFSELFYWPRLQLRHNRIVRLELEIVLKVMKL